MRSTPKFLRVLLLFCCSGLLLACGDKKLTADFPLEVLARAAGSEGQGVEGVALKLNDQEIGQTDEEGRFEGTFHGIEGQMVVLEIIPPDDFKLDEGSESTIKGVLTVDRPEDGEPKPKALSFLVDLKPISVDYVAIVSAPGKFRPIYLGDELKGRTNALGVEILHFRGKPGTEVQLRVDTQSKKNAPLLKKVMLDEHERVLTIDDKDEVKEESEAEKATRAKEAEEREQKALAQLEEKAKKQGGKTAVEKVEKVKAAPKEQEQADEADLEAVRQFSPKSVVKIETAAAATPKKETPPPAPVAEPFDKKAAGDIAKDVKKIHAAVSKAKAETGKVGGKLAKLAKQAGGAGVAERYKPGYQAAEARIEQALGQVKAADAALAAAIKAKDMAEVNRQYQAAKLAGSDAEVSFEEANRAFTSASEELNQAIAVAKAQEEQTRATTATAVEEAASSLAASQGELKNISKQAGTKVKGAKVGKKEAQGFAKEIDQAAREIGKSIAMVAGLKAKVKKAKAETLLDISTKANEGKTAGEGLLAKGKAAMAKLDEAITEKPAPPPTPPPTEVAVAQPPPPSAQPGAKPAGKKPVKPAPGAKPENKKCPPDLACELEALKGQVEEGEPDRCLIKVCEKVTVGSPNAEDINLAMAKYWGRVNKRGKQLAALDKVIAFGQYKYDPNILYGYIKVAVAARSFKKALEAKDRFMQVKERLSVDERKTKICEILSVLAQAYEHDFYAQQEKHEDQDFTPLLNNAIQFWEEYGSYCGDKAKATQKIEALKKLREEMVQ